MLSTLQHKCSDQEAKSRKGHSLALHPASTPSAHSSTMFPELYLWVYMFGLGLVHTSCSFSASADAMTLCIQFPSLQVQASLTRAESSLCQWVSAQTFRRQFNSMTIQFKHQNKFPTETYELLRPGLLARITSPGTAIYPHLTPCEKNSSPFSCRIKWPQFSHFFGDQTSVSQGTQVQMVPFHPRIQFYMFI